MTEDHSYRPGDIAVIKRDTPMHENWWGKKIRILEIEPNGPGQVRFEVIDEGKTRDFLMLSEIQPAVLCSHDTVLWSSEREEYFCPFCES